MHQEKVVTEVASKQALDLQALKGPTLEQRQLAMETTAASQHYSSPGSRKLQQSSLGGFGDSKHHL